MELAEKSYRPLLGDADVERIVLRSEFSPELKPGHKPTVTKLVRYEGRRYKVRRYQSDQLAQRQLDLMKSVPTQFVDCYGRVGPHLVLEYLEDETGQSHRSKEHLKELGVFLAELSSVNCNASGEGDFDAWCAELEGREIFGRDAVRRLREYYRRAEELKISWALEYFDPMPRNFVRCGDRLVSIDEKHLRVGPKGLGLIRPMWELSEAELKRVADGYESVSSLDRFLEPTYNEFLQLYYLVYGLAFVGVNKDKEANVKIREFHQRRRRALKLIGTPLIERLSEEVIWLPPYYLHRLLRYPKLGVIILKKITIKFFRSRAVSLELTGRERTCVNDDLRGT